MTTIPNTPVLMFFLGFLIGAIVFLAVIFWLRSLRIKRINELAQTVMHHVRGDSAGSIPLEGKGEFVPLIQAMEHMASVLRKRIAEAESEQAKLSAILEHMVEGVVAVDAQKNVLVVNPSAKRMLRIEGENLLGQTLIETVRNEKMDAMIEEVLSSARPVS